MSNVTTSGGKRNITIGAQSALLPSSPDDFDKLGGGIRASFPVLSIDGKVWTMKYEKQESPLLDNRGHPVPEIEVVILEAPSHTSKLFYDKPYVAKSGMLPACYSSNGIAPDKDVANPVSPTCAGCPNNERGSRMYNGKALKACADQKRLVVVPASDIPNESWGGPILLRVPAGSLKNLKLYGDMLKQHKALFYGNTTFMSFDPTQSHQKLVFDYGRPLNDEEARQVIALRAGDQINTILKTEPASADSDAGEVVHEPDESIDPANPTVHVPEAQVNNVQPEKVEPRIFQKTENQGIGKPPPSPHATQKPVQAIPPAPARGIPANPEKAPQPAARPATQPSGDASNTRISGGFGKPSTPITPTAPAPSARAATGIRNTGSISTIGTAVNNPAPAPVSARQVVTPPAPEEVQQEELGVTLPSELDDTFGKLVNKV